MSGNSQKTHLARSLNRFAEQKALDALQVTGKALPCHVVSVSGAIVTVKFDVTGPFTLPDVTCTTSGPEYIRYPTQVGDKGVVMSADYYIGGVTGLGGGVADLSLRANLSALVFFPVGNSNWAASDDPSKIVLYGPNGAVIRTTDSANVLTVDGTNVRTSGTFQAGNGATGTIHTASVQTVQVSKGIITSIT